MKTLKQELIKCIDWITRKDSPYAICYGSETRFATHDEDLTTEQVVDVYLQSHKPEIKSAEEILKKYDEESIDRIMDNIEYKERVIIPAMQEYAMQGIELPSELKEKIIEIINFGIEQERAECKADEIIQLFQSYL